MVDEATGPLVGALSDLQARRIGELARAAEQEFTLLSFPDVPHAMHSYQPKLYTDTIVDWAAKLRLDR